MRFLLLALILIFSTPAYGAEIIADFSENSLSVLNEELRFLRKRVSAVTGFIGNNIEACNATATTYLPPFSYDCWTTETIVDDFRMPFDGTFKYMQVSVLNVPGSGNSWKGVLRINRANTNIVCTITEASNHCFNDSAAVRFYRGDVITFAIVATGTPTGTAAVSWAVGFRVDNT